MYPYVRLVTLLLLLLLALPGCTRHTAKSPGEAADTPENASALSPEAEVKPAPMDGLPAAVPPVVAPPRPVAPPAVPVVPEQATKQALDPKPARTAAMTPPRSEPVEPMPDMPAAARPDAPAPSLETRAAKGKARPEAAPSPDDQTPAAARGKAKSDGPAVAVVGDSLAVGVGMTMEARLNKAGNIGCRPMGKISTGLISKKKYDWDKELAALLARDRISTVVVVLGGNDANNAIAGKGAGTPEWNAAYADKAERFLRIAADAHVQVLWVGLPAMKEAAYSKRVAAVNAAAKTACSKVTGCTYMEASDIFTDEAGNYVQAKAIDGRTVSLRAGDGVHMTMTGYDLLCRRVLDKLDLTGGRPRQ